MGTPGLSFEPDAMPRVSHFFGISIYIYYRDHAPPHFHAIYGENEGWIGIGDLAILKGNLGPRTTALVLEWASGHQSELRENWTRARNHEPLEPIEPLR